MNIELLNRAKEYIEKLANGINPSTGELIPNDSILNDVKIIRCLFFVKDVLDDNINKCMKAQKKENKIPFNLTKEELKNYSFENISLPISKIAKKINDLKQDDKMMKFKVTDLTKWLISIGLLEIKDQYGKKIKLPTNEGKKMGMILEHRRGSYGNYSIILYKKEMQEFIINNFECLIDFINMETL